MDMIVHMTTGASARTTIVAVMDTTSDSATDTFTPTGRSPDNIITTRTTPAEGTMKAHIDTLLLLKTL